ncbi:MAG: hypothetical protein LBK44_05210 [Spirochaetales bacterium]|nr:hypothetical protein [Spirochaetales bacterium]
MQILWAFRYNPLRMTAQNQAVILPSAKSRVHNCYFSNYVPITRRSQFCSDKIAWSVTKHEAKRNARSYHQPAVAAAAQHKAPELPLAIPRPGFQSASVDACF